MRIANVLKRVAVWSLVRFKFVLQRFLPKKRAEVFFDCADDWRYPSYLIRALRSMGDVIMEVPASGALFFLRNSSLFDFVFRVSIVGADAVPGADIVISRNVQIRGVRARSRAQLSVDYFFEDHKADELGMPYFIHPKLWAFEREFPELRKESRSIRIGFAGTVNARAYTDSFAFPIMNRTEIFDVLFDQFSNRMEFVTHCDQYRKALVKSPSILIVAVDVPGDTTKKHILRAREYLGFLGNCDFFIAPPGYEMPFSHNLIEAMFLGAIPLLNYGTYLTPHLRNGSIALASPHLMN